MASTEGVDYDQLQRTRPYAWWRPVLGVVSLAVLWQFVVPIGLLVMFGVGYLLIGSNDVAGDTEALLDTSNTTPTSLAFLCLTLGLAIPAVMLVSLLLHRLSPGWLASVVGRLRWRWMLLCVGLSIVALMATVAVGTLFPAGTEGAELSGTVNDLTSTTRDFALIVLFLVPLQAAGEEYVFRGYLTQAFGGLFRARWAAVLFPALLFALAHGAQDPPIFVDRFAFGLVAGVLVIATGGLEAGIAMHVLNNFLAFGLALLFSDMSSALNPTGGSWWSLPTTLTQSLVYLGLAIWAARRMGVATRVPAALEPVSPRV